MPLTPPPVLPVTGEVSEETAVGVVAAAPTLLVQDVAGAEDRAIPLAVTILGNGAAAERIDLTIAGIPDGAAIRTVDGTVLAFDPAGTDPGYTVIAVTEGDAVVASDIKIV